MESPNLLVMGKLRIDCIQGGLRLFPAHVPRNNRRKKSAAINHNHHLLCSGEMASDFLFDRFWGNLVARSENNQIFDPAYDPPISGSISLALIARLKPSIAQHFRRLLRPVPVAWKNIWPADDDLLVVAEFHLNTLN